MKNLLIILLLLPAYSFSQEAGKEKIKVQVTGTIGTAAGESGVKPLFQLSGGFFYHNYFTGVGIGYDTYKFNSIPVFVDWRFHFGDKKVLFVYANGGYNVPGSYHHEPEFGKTMDKMKAGYYMDAGFGYRFPVGKTHHISLSTGYSRKSTTNKRVFAYPCSFPGCGEVETIYAYHYNFGRIVTKLSWQ